MALLEALHRLQEERGWLAAEDLRALAAERNVPLHALESLAGFYPHFRRRPPRGPVVSLCRDLPCALAGGAAHGRRVRELLEGKAVEVREVSCLGRCDAAPAAAVEDVPLGGCTPEQVATAAARDPASLPPAPRPPRRVFFGHERPPYAVLEGVLSGGETARDRILAELEAAGLRGMGGAGFPTATKWRLVREQKRGPKYVVCNADESEPGTFKDRDLLGQAPELVLEGILLGAFTAGARDCIVYLRHEYRPERAVLEEALEDLRTRGLIGEGAPFEVRIFVSPGGYILGEETALLEALEDRRGEPRNKPPFPVAHGLFGQPTLINNVETLAMVPAILDQGATRWKERGRPGFAGPKLMAVSGHVARPGVFEVPLGLTVAELVREAGGVAGGRLVKAFLPGGASSNFLPASKLDTPLDFQTMAQAGSMLGSGALVVLAEGTDVAEAALGVTRFFRNESCGKCVPCRVGTEKAVALVEEARAGRRPPEDLGLLPELHETLRLTSICGLGQVALSPLLSAMQAFPAEFPGTPRTAAGPQG